MIANRLERLPTLATVVVAVLVVAACAMQLRGDEDQTSPAASVAPGSDPAAERLKQCRAVTYEQKEALLECRKIWAEKRRQFLEQNREIEPDARRDRLLPSAAPLPEPERK